MGRDKCASPPSAACYRALSISLILDGMDASTLLRDSRLARGLTQAELALRLGRAQSTVAALERPGANPSVATLQEVLSALGYRLDLTAAPDRSGVDATLIERNL